jgi:hypothetical protein
MDSKELPAAVKGFPPAATCCGNTSVKGSPMSVSATRMTNVNELTAPPSKQEII